MTRKKMVARRARHSREDAEADARGLSEYLNVRVAPWLKADLEMIAKLEGRSKGNLARHALEIGLRFYRNRHEKDLKALKKGGE